MVRSLEDFHRLGTGPLDDGRRKGDADDAGPSICGFSLDLDRFGKGGKQTSHIFDFCNSRVFLFLREGHSVASPRGGWILISIEHSSLK